MCLTTHLSKRKKINTKDFIYVYSSNIWYFSTDKTEKKFSNLIPTSVSDWKRIPNYAPIYMKRQLNCASPKRRADCLKCSPSTRYNTIISKNSRDSSRHHASKALHGPPVLVLQLIYSFDLNVYREQGGGKTDT